MSNELLTISNEQLRISNYEWFDGICDVVRAIGGDCNIADCGFYFRNERR